MVPPQDGSEIGTVVIGEGIARTRGASPGDVLAIRGQDGELFAFTVASVLPATSNIVSADLMLLSESDFRRFFAITPSLFTDITLRLSNHEAAQAIADRLVSQLPGTRAIGRDDVLGFYRFVLDWREGMIMVLVLGALMALMIFTIQKATGLSAEERHEIWVLKAVGWDTFDVVASKIWEGVLISATAFLVGSTLAYWHVFSASYLFLEPVLVGWSALKPTLHLVPFVDGLQLLLLCLCTVVPYALATTVPIWRVAVADSNTLVR
jgi:ABC-type lipoprotein release transport system permease subunit